MYWTDLRYGKAYINDVNQVENRSVVFEVMVLVVNLMTYGHDLSPSLDALVVCGDSIDKVATDTRT